MFKLQCPDPNCDGYIVTSTARCSKCSTKGKR